MESIYALFYNEPAFTPFPVSAQRVAAGLWGQKTGAGWFSYQNGRKIEPPVVPAPTARPTSVWLQRSAEHPELETPVLELITGPVSPWRQAPPRVHGP
jgi:3-hydroxybutyryl-CoA dehydrogenase